jgi:hypothetical protein
MAKRINNTLFYTLLLAVYAVFFSVQFFYNFDGQSEVKKGVSMAKTAPSHFSSTHPSSAHSPSTHTIRLNKRFHQENMTPCTILSVDAPRQYVIRATLEHYRNIFLPSFFPVHHPLRGPPVVA